MSIRGCEEDYGEDSTTTCSSPVPHMERYTSHVKMMIIIYTRIIFLIEKEQQQHQKNISLDVTWHNKYYSCCLFTINLLKVCGSSLCLLGFMVWCVDVDDVRYTNRYPGSTHSSLSYQTNTGHMTSTSFSPTSPELGDSIVITRDEVRTKGKLT